MKAVIAGVQPAGLVEEVDGIIIIGGGLSGGSGGGEGYGLGGLSGRLGSDGPCGKDLRSASYNVFWRFAEAEIAAKWWCVVRGVG